MHRTRRQNPGRERRDRHVGVWLMIGAACGFLLAAMGNGRMVELRREYGLGAADPLENAPPAVAFTTVLFGGFRGLIADALWLRAARMQEEGRYFELVQLADWITKLEPRSTETWAFHAWNMAYNISIMMSDEKERWRWVHNGVELLLRDGLRYNPGDPRLYFELGWLFQHKIGGRTDRSHAYYKQRWAEEMTDVLGGGDPDYASLEGDAARLSRMEKAYGLLPKRMREVDRVYGPLDWRTPETHAIYWAHLGRQRADDGRFLPCDRMIYQCMSASFARGRLVHDDRSGQLVAQPNLDILPKVLAAYEAALQTYPIDSTEQAYANFMQAAVIMLSRSGMKDEARQVFERWRRRFPGAETAAGFDAYLRQWEGVEP